MTLFTKFRQLSETLQTVLKEKFGYFETKFSFSLFLLFLGFVFGNLFGTFLNFFRTYIIWDGFIMMLGLVSIEILNYISFNRENDPRLKHLNSNHNPKRSVNFLKIGLLLGFFIDAFKVGS